MPIMDASIYSQVKPVQINDPLDTYGKAQALKMGDQTMAMNKMKLDATQREQAEDAMIEAAINTSLDPGTGQIDHKSVISKLQSTNPRAAMRYSAEVTKMNMATDEAQLKRLELASKMTTEERAQAQKNAEMLNKTTAWIKSQPDPSKAWDMAVTTMGAPKLAGQYSTELLELYEQLGATLDESLKPEFLLRMQTLDETKRHNRAMENKSSGGGGATRAPSGYRYTGEGDLEPIPGGPADAKRAAEIAKLQSSIDSTGTTIDTATRLLNHPGLAGAVGTWSYTRFAPGTDAANFQAELESFKAQTFVPMIQKMRGLGQLSDAEGKKLTDAVGALSNNMSEQAFKESLARIIGELNRVRSRAESGLNGRSQEALAPVKTQAGGLQKLSPADAARLPRGTHFIGLDGVERVKN